MATVVLIAGIVEREAGLSSAVLSRSSSPSRSLLRGSPTSSTKSRESGQGMKTKTKVLIGLGTYFAIAILMLLIFGSSGKNEEFQPQNEFKLEPWITIESAASTSASTRRSSTSSWPAP